MNDENIDKAIEYIRKTPVIRDVIISGGDPLVLSDEKLESIIKRIRAIPHVEIIRIGTRTPVVMPMRITDDLVNMLQEVPARSTSTRTSTTRRRSRPRPRGLPQARRRRHPPRQPVRPPARRERLPRPHEEAPPEAPRRSACAPTTSTSATSPRASPTSAPRCPRASRSSRTCAATPPASRSRPSSSTPPAAAARRRSSRLPHLAANHQVILRNYEGVITQYTEPADYVEGQCECEDCASRPRRSALAWRGSSTRRMWCSTTCGMPAGRRSSIASRSWPTSTDRCRWRTDAALRRRSIRDRRTAPTTTDGDRQEADVAKRVMVEPIGVTVEIAEGRTCWTQSRTPPSRYPPTAPGAAMCGVVRPGAGEVTPPTEAELARLRLSSSCARWLEAGLPDVADLGRGQHRRARAGGRRQILSASKLHHGAVACRHRRLVELPPSTLRTTRRSIDS